MAIQADISSYPRPAPHKSVIDQAKDITSLHGAVQGLERQDIAIDSDKLALANKQWGLVNHELATLADDPNLTHDKVVQRFGSIAKTYRIPPPMASEFLAEIPKPTGNPEVDKQAMRDYIKTTVKRGQDINSMLNTMTGVKGTAQSGGATYPTTTRPFEGLEQTGPAIGASYSPQQLDELIDYQDPVSGQISKITRRQWLERQGTPAPMPPGQVAPISPVVGTGAGRMPVAPPPGGAPMQPPMQPPGAMAAPPAVPMPRQRPGAGAGMPVEQPLVPIKTKTQSFPAPGGDRPIGKPSEGVDVTFAPGLKAFEADQNQAADIGTAMKPLLSAWPLLQGLRTGPGTKPFNDFAAFLKANGALDTKAANDPTAVYQEATKYLKDYLRRSPSVSRSDAAQYLGEQASPDPKGQINQALVKIVRSAMANDRVLMARAMAFRDQTLDDKGQPLPGDKGKLALGKYLDFKGAFQQATDQRAFVLDLMPDDERNALLDKMQKEVEKGSLEGNKFAISLRLAKRLNVIDPALIQKVDK